MQKGKKKKIIIAIILLVIILAAAIAGTIYYLRYVDHTKNTKIVATKTVTENEQTKEIKYTIKVKNYEIVNVEKEIAFNSKEEAQEEYDRYQTINQNERRGIQAELKKKKVIITMTEEEFKEDIGYEKEYKIRITTETGEEKDIIDQGFLVLQLQDQGYTIK